MFFLKCEKNVKYVFSSTDDDDDDDDDDVKPKTSLTADDKVYYCWPSLFFFFFIFIFSFLEPFGPNTIFLHVARSCNSRTASHSVSLVQTVIIVYSLLQRSSSLSYDVDQSL